MLTPDAVPLGSRFAQIATEYVDLLGRPPECQRLVASGILAVRTVRVVKDRAERRLPDIPIGLALERHRHHLGVALLTAPGPPPGAVGAPCSPAPARPQAGGSAGGYAVPDGVVSLPGRRGAGRPGPPPRGLGGRTWSSPLPGAQHPQRPAYARLQSGRAC